MNVLVAIETYHMTSRHPVNRLWAFINQFSEKSCRDNLFHFLKGFQYIMQSEVFSLFIIIIICHNELSGLENEQ